jgi:hypothetical protein
MSNFRTIHEWNKGIFEKCNTIYKTSHPNIRKSQFQKNENEIFLYFDINYFEIQHDLLNYRYKMKFGI